MLSVGGAGGPTIIMGVLQAVTNAVDFRLDPAEALDAPRVDCCAFHANKVMIENGRISDAVVKELGTAHAQGGRGHLLAIDPAGPLNYADGPELQAAGVDVHTNERLGASDPRDECGAAAHDANGTIVYQCGGWDEIADKECSDEKSKVIGSGCGRDIAFRIASDSSYRLDGDTLYRHGR
jgi:hypothetical protein